jgi:hypothetical protein
LALAGAGALAATTALAVVLRAGTHSLGLPVALAEVGVRVTTKVDTTAVQAVAQVRRAMEALTLAGTLFPDKDMPVVALITVLAEVAVVPEESEKMRDQITTAATAVWD